MRNRCTSLGLAGLSVILGLCHASPAAIAGEGASFVPISSSASKAVRSPAAPARIRQGKLAGPTFFVLGVWVAPPDEMHKWRERGINTILSVGDGVNPDQHHARAVTLGLAQIRHPRPDKIAEDLASPSVIAFETSDEPTNLVNGLPREPPDGVSAEQAPWRAAAKAAGVEKPVFTNHIGNHIWHQLSRVGLNLAEYHKRSHWYGADTYQIGDGKENLLTQDGFTSTYQGHILRHQRAMAPDAPLLSFVQTVAYEAGVKVPTPGELATQIWSSVVNDASMIGVFPVRLPPSFAWDATPEPLAATLKSEFAKITAIEDVLIDREKGGTRPGKIHASAPKGAKPGPGQLPWPFEARIIPHEGKTYSIVVNLSEAPASLTHAEWGVSDVPFQPHEVKRGYGQDWIKADGTVPAAAAAAAAAKVGPNDPLKLSKDDRDQLEWIGDRIGALTPDGEVTLSRVDRDELDWMANKIREIIKR